MTWYMAQLDGAEWNSPHTDRHRAKVVGGTAAVVGGTAIFGGFKFALDKILLSPTPAAGRLFDTLAKHDETAPRLNLRSFSLLGPSATSHTIRQFGRLHGMQCASIFLAGMWAVMLTPVVQARAEVATVHWGPPKTASERDRAMQELKRIMGNDERPATAVRDDDDDDTNNDDDDAVGVTAEPAVDGGTSSVAAPASLA